MHPALNISGIILAYLDPGSGSYLVQLLIAALVGGGFLIKTFWRQITAFFTQLFTGKKPIDEVKEENTDGEPK